MSEQEIFSLALTGQFKKKEDPTKEENSLIRLKKLCCYEHDDAPIKIHKKLKISWSISQQSFFNQDDKKFYSEEEVRRLFFEMHSLKWNGHKISSDPLRDLWAKLKENDCYERLEIFIRVNLLKSLPMQCDKEEKVCLYIDRIFNGHNNIYLKKSEIVEIVQEIVEKKVTVLFLSKEQEDMIKPLPVYEYEYLFWKLIHC